MLGSLFTILTSHLLNIIDKGTTILDIIAGYRFFTMQSNILVLIWLILAIYFNAKDYRI